MMSLSVKRKLQFMIFAFVAITLTCATVTFLALDTLSSVRAYVGGEGMWSKGQKDAIFYITRYASSAEDVHFNLFKASLSVIKGDRAARLELEKPNADLAIAAAGFIAGGNHPADVRGMSLLYQRGRNIPYLDEAIHIWSTADVVIDELEALADDMHVKMQLHPLNEAQMQQYLTEIDRLNIRLTNLENQFSTVLGEAARWMKRVLVTSTIIASIAAAAIGLWFSTRLAKGILTGLEKLTDATQSVERGKILTIIELTGDDELTQLSRSFNRMTSSLANITHQRNAAIERLTAQTAELQDAQQIAHVGSWEWDIETDQIDISTEVYRILGFADAVPRSPFPVKPLLPLNLDATLRSIFESVLELSYKGQSFIDDIKPRPDGDERNLHIRWRILRTPTGTINKLVGVIQDITELQRLQTKMVQSSKMASVGEMAAGIAHEINNPLSIILAWSQQIQRVLKKSPSEVDSAIKFAGIIETTSIRISSIVKGLKSLSRSGEADPFAPVDLVGVIDETLELYAERFRKYGIEVHFQRPDARILISGRKVQLSQVLLNLLNNAHDAINDQQERWIRILLEYEDGSARIRVTDSGPGIPEPLAEKIMQPFFTTKDLGKGTGLGLSISRSIIEDHGGRLLLDRSHENTCFVLVFPLNDSHVGVNTTETMRPELS